LGATESLARLVSETTWDAIADQAHHARRSLLNFFATGIGSAHDPAVAAGLSVLAPFSGPATSALIGRGERLDMMGAAFLNAVSANLLDFDDTHMATIIHPAAPVAAPALALAERLGAACTGRDVLTAIVLGVEVECRIGRAVSPGHYARGWHITSTCGVFGSAAAAAKLLGLPAAGIATALGIAASQSAGVVENLPSAAKNVSVGGAARNGLYAALFAQAGWGAAPLAIDGPLGWARAMGDAPDMDALTGSLGATWEIAVNTYKPYPSGIVFHAVIDACLALREELAGDAVESVLVEGSALLLARGDRPVRTERDARVSIHHAAACGLVLGRAGPHEFSLAVVNDPVVVALRDRVRAALDPALPDGAARISLVTQSGRRIETTVRSARGGLDHPLSDADLEAKLRDGVRQNGSALDADRIIDAVWSLDQAGSVAPLMAAAAGL
jgi:2-methylcitrate dehydratase PrpD